VSTAAWQDGCYLSFIRNALTCMNSDTNSVPAIDAIWVVRIHNTLYEWIPFSQQCPPLS